MVSVFPFRVRSIFRTLSDTSSTLPAVLISGTRGVTDGAAALDFRRQKPV